MKRPYEQHRWQDWEAADEWAEAIREKGTWAEVEEAGDEYIVKVILNAEVASTWVLEEEEEG